MEPEIIDLETAAKGLAILSFVPVALFALWADYFGRSIEELRTDQPQFDPAPEIEKVRIASLLVILFQFTLFLSSPEVRGAYPFVYQVTLIAAVLLQLFSQSQTERKIQTPERSTDDIFMLAIRVAGIWTAGGLLYLLVLATTLKLSSFVLGFVQPTPFLKTSVLLLGGGVGAILGLVINFVLGPLYLRLLFPIQSLEGQETKSNLEACFLKAGFIPRFWVIDFKMIHLTDFITVGMKGARGPLQPAVFIPRQLLATLHSKELEAIALIQSSHILLHHMRRRFLFSLFLILVTTFLALLSVFLSQPEIMGHTLWGLLLPALALTSFFTSFKLLSHQAKKHVLEADIYSIEKLGVNLDTLILALRGLGAPWEQEIELRIQHLQNHFGMTESSSSKNQSRAS